VHRDLKPENILIRKADNQVFLTDFGLASEVRNSLSGKKGIEQDISGTLPYMAPEQYWSQRIDSRTDNWAWGVIAYEMIEGNHPFQGVNFDHYMKIICEIAPPEPEVMPKESWNLLKALFHKDRKQRLEKLVPLVKELERIGKPKLYPDLQEIKREQEKQGRKERERQEAIAKAENERKEKERQEAIAKAEQERKERERQAAIAKAENERKERERQAAIATVEEERERERQEAIAKAEQEREEIERRATIAKTIAKEEKKKANKSKRKIKYVALLILFAILGIVFSGLFSSTSSDGRYRVLSSGIIRDTKTNLEWLVGPDKDTSWDEAKAWVDGLSTRQYGTGWRMPTREELPTIYKKGKGKCNIDPVFVSPRDYLWVWSGELEGSSSAWGFNFRRGYEGWYARSSRIVSRAFAVRFGR
jgi:serine/threonine protein kinase